MAKYVAVCDDGGNVANLTFPCSGEVLYLPASTQVPFDPTMIDPIVATEIFAGGFFFMVPVWVACIGVRYLLSMLR